MLLWRVAGQIVKRCLRLGAWWAETRGRKSGHREPDVDMLLAYSNDREYDSRPMVTGPPSQTTKPKFGRS
jgi:hypothetical protein